MRSKESGITKHKKVYLEGEGHTDS